MCVQHSAHTSSAETCLPRIGLHFPLQAGTMEECHSVNTRPASAPHHSNMPFDWIACLFQLRMTPHHSTLPHLSHHWQIGVCGNTTTPSPALTPPGFLYIIHTWVKFVFLAEIYLTKTIFFPNLHQETSSWQKILKANVSQENIISLFSPLPRVHCSSSP